MAIEKIECPNCGGSITMDTDSPIKFCSFCGKQVLVDDGVQRIKITDDAKIKRAEVSERIRLEELKAQEKKERRENINYWLGMGILIAGVLACLIWLILH